MRRQFRPIAPPVPTFPNVGFVGFTGTWTSTLAGGGLNFNLPSGGLDTIGGFLATGTGSLTNFVSVNGGALTDELSAGNFSEATLFIFSGTVVGPNSGNITHDDGIGVKLNGTLITPPNDQNPTVAEMTAYSIGAGDIGKTGSCFMSRRITCPRFSQVPICLELPSPERYGCLARVSVASQC